MPRKATPHHMHALTKASAHHLHKHGHIDDETHSKIIKHAHRGMARAKARNAPPPMQDDGDEDAGY